MNWKSAACCDLIYDFRADVVFESLRRRRNMKRNLSRWLGVLVVALLPVFSRAPAGPTGKVHGKVIDPTGEPQGSGSVSLSTDGGATLKCTFPVGTDGTFSGDAAPGTY